MTDKIISSVDGTIGSLVFSNPERRNAITLEMALAATQVIDEFSANSAVRVIVLSGDGDKAFISGGDISKFESERATKEQVDQYNEKAARFRTRLRNVGKPTIAMIRGYCLGGGMAVALCCDVRIASDDARLGIPAAKLGIGYGAEGLRDLLSVVGPATAKDMLFTGRQIDASEAALLGLVNRVLPSAELADFVKGYADTIAANAPLSIVAAKRVIDELGKDVHDRDEALCSRVVAACFESEDYVEGRRAFMQRRKPIFMGR